jgi:inorganic pyrophosphatase
MHKEQLMKTLQTLGLRFKSHPWHGIHPGKKAPEQVRCYVECVPGDEMKYEVCKETGFLMIDRPNKFSNIMPVLYGFIPQTYCAEQVAEFCMEKINRTDIQGDGDPLDVCILTDRHIPHGDLLADGFVIGGFRMIDGGEADDKILVVLKDDQTYGHLRDVSEVPEKLIKRIKHYFLTYKEDPDKLGQVEVEITHTYGREEALEVVRRSIADYNQHYGNLPQDISEALQQLFQQSNTL